MAASSVLNSQIADASVDASGEETRRYRLDLQYEDSGNALISIAKGEPIDSVMTLSMRNIANAHHVVTEFLTSEFGKDASAVRRFYGYLTNKVKLIRIQTEDRCQGAQNLRDDQRPRGRPELYGSPEEPAFHEGDASTVRPTEGYVEGITGYDLRDGREALAIPTLFHLQPL